MPEVNSFWEENTLLDEPKRTYSPSSPPLALLPLMVRMCILLHISRIIRAIINEATISHSWRPPHVPDRPIRHFGILFFCLALRASVAQFGLKRIRIISPVRLSSRIGELIIHNIYAFCFNTNVVFRYMPYVGMVTILMNDYPYLKYILIAVLGLFVLSTRE